MARALFLGDSLPSARNLYIGISMLPFNDADLNAVNVTSVTTFKNHEYDGSGYARKAVGTLTITKDGTFHTWNAKDGVIDFGTLGPCSGSNKGKFAMMFMGATLDASGDGASIPIAVYDNSPIFPLNGTGSKRIKVKFETRGAIFGPNCTPSTNMALTVGDSLYLAERMV